MGEYTKRKQLKMHDYIISSIHLCNWKLKTKNWKLKTILLILLMYYCCIIVVIVVIVTCQSERKMQNHNQSKDYTWLQSLYIRHIIQNLLLLLLHCNPPFFNSHLCTHTHTHTHIYIYIHLQICVTFIMYNLTSSSFKRVAVACYI